jgi:maleate cis-trans isomerase
MMKEDLNMSWRARIGYIRPGQSNEMGPRDFWAMAPPGVSSVHSFAGIREISVDEVDSALGGLQRAVEELRDHDVDLIHIGGLPLVTYHGPASEGPLLQAVTALSGKPATTDFSAQVAAFRALGVDRVVLHGPNRRDVTETFRRSVESVGINVVYVDCPDLPRSQIPRVPDREIYQAAKRAFLSAPGAQAIWIPCGNYGAARVVDALEEDTGVPVIAHNPAALWYDLNLLHISTRSIRGFGRLFQVSPSQSAVPLLEHAASAPLT